MADERSAFKPLSEDPPTKSDLELSELLLTELKAQKNFESQEETKKREVVLKKLYQLTKELVQVVGRAKKLPPAILENAGGKVFTFGSYKLMVYGPGSDIDTLVIGPKHVTREDFFKYFPDLLRKNTAPGDITEMTIVPDASVPIIKMEVSGISVDLIYSNLQQSSVPASLKLTDNTLLRGLNDVDLKCVNGTRVTDRILDLVPQSKPFRLALRTIKLWAQRRALYGNVSSFPSGVGYAMMVAKVCQLYPKAAAPRIVSRFFWLMSNWRWPDPVRLQLREDAPLQLREWDPNTSYAEKKHLMPIITPAYPSMNATHAITPSTKAVLMKELKRGLELAEAITVAKTKTWKDLFQKHTFFTEDYKHYLVVTAATRSKDALAAWSGLCQAKIRRLIIKVEEMQGSVEIAHPFNKGVNRVHECNADDEDKVLQGNLTFQIKETEVIDTANDVKAQAAVQADANGTALETSNDETQQETADGGKQRIYTTSFYVGLGLKKDAKSLDISYAISDYKEFIKNSPLHDPDMHSIRVTHVRNYDLPDDLFSEGESRPVRPKKSKAAKSAQPTPTPAPAPAPNGVANNKRTVSSAGLDENKDPAKRRQSANGLVVGMTNGHAP